MYRPKCVVFSPYITSETFYTSCRVWKKPLFFSNFNLGFMKETHKWPRISPRWFSPPSTSDKQCTMINNCTYFTLFVHFHGSCNTITQGSLLCLHLPLPIQITLLLIPLFYPTLSLHRLFKMQTSHDGAIRCCQHKEWHLLSFRSLKNTRTHTNCMCCTWPKLDSH